MDELVKTMLNDIDRIKAENEKLKAENQKQKEILNRLSQTKVNHQIKNPFAFTSGLCCHHCDHKDEYIIELEEENEELKKMLKLAVEEIERLMRSLCCRTQYQPKREPCNECLYKFVCKDPENYVERPCWGGTKAAKKLIGDDKNA